MIKRMRIYKKDKIIIVILVSIVILGISIVLLDFLKGKQLPNVLLITVDSLRPDHLSCYGYNRNTSPNIDKVAQEGLLFTQAIAPASYTVPSIVLILTSTLPLLHKVDNWGIYIPSELISLAEVLKTKGESMQILVEIGKTLRIASPSIFRDTPMYPHPEIFAYRAFQGLFFLLPCQLLS